MLSEMQTQIRLREPPPEPASPTDLSSYALVEIFGHTRIVGWLSQQTFGTGVMFRVDVPDLLKDGKVIRVGFTRYFGIAAIYSITPCSEDMVRQLLPNIDGTPGEARALQSRSYSRDDDYEDGI